MRYTKLCPKCNSCEILIIPATWKSLSNVIYSAWTLEGCAGLTRYVCSDCGFSEEWVTDRDDLQELKRKYQAQPK